MMQRLALLTACVWLCLPGMAWAHGDIARTDPPEGSKVRRAPSVVAIQFTESPTADNRFEVIDGCGDDVLAQVGGEGTNAELAVAGGQPGRWRVTYNVISSEDGHNSRGAFSFTVAGKRDCSEPAATDSPEIGSPPPPIANDDADPASFPVVPVLIGGGAIVGLAVAIRIFSAR